MEEFLKGDKQCKKLYTQNTGIFSYVAITSALLTNINEMMKYVNKHKLYLNHNKQMLNVEEIMDLFVDSINKPRFVKNINRILDNMHLINKSKFMKNTFRMSCIELK